MGCLWLRLHHGFETQSETSRRSVAQCIFGATEGLRSAEATRSGGFAKTSRTRPVQGSPSTWDSAAPTSPLRCLQCSAASKCSDCSQQEANMQNARQHASRIACHHPPHASRCMQELPGIQGVHKHRAGFQRGIRATAAMHPSCLEPFSGFSTSELSLHVQEFVQVRMGSLGFWPSPHPPYCTPLFPRRPGLINFKHGSKASGIQRPR